MTVWSGITINHRTAIVEMGPTTYIVTILQPHVAPFMQNHLGYILRQDNDPAHRARETQAYIAGRQIGVIHPWLTESFNMKPIKHLGHSRPSHPRDESCYSELRSINSKPNQRLERQTHQIFNIVNLMSCRCQTVIAAGSGYTLILPNFQPLPEMLLD
ncbi:transposable element tc1 transposase [Plakobranchus ocellatus]|uniref:Transposable element tc1 transposase n=1 Tax=Plakobranchus ocellatus TaxID=259542 RepID=A0AAV3YHC4_9GAST|nr:transposable element tc1 transposase [Plakobranchus ocellatus]